MKIALNSIHSDEYLKKADEIIVRYYKVGELLDICEKYPDKDIVVDVPEG